MAPWQWPLLLDDLDAQSLYDAVGQSLVYLGRIPPSRSFRFGQLTYSAAEMTRALVRLRDVLIRLPDPEERTRALQDEFILLRSRGGGGGSVLFTGYYEPVLPARKRPVPPYLHPLYAHPKDLVTVDLSLFGVTAKKRRLVGRLQDSRLTPYPDRESIDYRRALAGKAEILAFLADPVETFFMQIQGSGQVVFADGSRLRLGYAAQNGHPYRSIGKLLVKEGLMELSEASMQAIRKFFQNNPGQLRRVLSSNPSYVFFRPLPVEGGPPGAYGVPVTAGRSIATDRRYFPGLAMAYVQGVIPAQGGQEIRLARFVLNQDTGGAIRGPGRVDLFFGTGKGAGELAGRTKHHGQLFFLAPKKYR